VRDRARAVLARGGDGLDDREVDQHLHEGRGSDAVAMMSRSLTESDSRRSEPASSTRSAPGGRAARRRPARRRRGRERGAPGLGRPVDAGLEHLEELLLDLAPKPRIPRIFCCSQAVAQRLERVDPELVVELAGALGAEAGQVGDGDQSARVLRAQLLGGRDVPGVDERVQLLLERLADPGRAR
jgi:hypothetical protein